MNFAKGDIVQLKSGGPKMTVKGIVGDSVRRYRTNPFVW